MTRSRGRHKRAGRWLLISFVAGLCESLLVINALNFFSRGDNFSAFGLASFGFSALTAMVYLAVGSLVFLFAHQRRVAQLLFCFALAMTVTFANETASARSVPWLAAITGISGVVALASFAILLLIFPYDYLAAARARREAKKGGKPGLLSGLYIGIHLTFVVLIASYTVARNVLALQLPAWLHAMINCYYLFAVASILLTILVSYGLSNDLRTRQQFLLFVVGVILSCTPFLCLTVLPQTLNLPERYVVDGQWSSLPLLFLPLALGYSVLRYQILVFDLYIRRAVAWAVGTIGLAIVCYLVIALSGLFFAEAQLKLEHILYVTVAMGLLGPLTWWLARLTTERIFFPEFRHYRLQIQRPESFSRETFDLNTASELLLLATMQAFTTQEVCLYIFDERTGSYHLSPTLEKYRNQPVMRGQLLWQLATFTQIFGSGNVDIVEAKHPLIQRVDSAQRPLFLHEALDEEKDGPAGISRYLVTSPLDGGVDPLLVPIRVQGKMIGLLWLGERGGGQMYAGPDFEFIEQLLARFSSMLETARLYVQASRHVAVLNALYSASARLERTYLQIEEAASAYATVVAEALQATAEIWLYVPENAMLQRSVHAGQEPSLLSNEWIGQMQEQDWSPWFQESSGQATPFRHAPNCLEHLIGTNTPFAWLPLCKGQRRLGILILSFAQPHIFSLEEKRVLSMFARQCAAAMENAQITIALRAAYDRQKELDQLKDQFIMTASHELRTPLTAVQGYIDLLDQYNDELSIEMRTEFIEKAHRSCDELALMVGNIMDASRVQIDVERVRLIPVELAAEVHHVMEILEAMTTREQRPVNLAISPGLLVLADELRLRQILLNLVSNALKYSPTGTTIQILALQGPDQVKVSVRDYGLGVPPEDQQRLFERFTRLERDMNSPVRGAGLGLYITKRLVEAMNGRLWVESSGVPGEGSTFSFTLQRAMVSQPLVNETTPLLVRGTR